MRGDDSDKSGPIDEALHPDHLDSHVVTPGFEPRVHGYDIERDLVVHYSLMDTLFLTLTGELPERWQSRAVEIALGFLAPISVADAPSHSAVLARICGGRISSIAGVASLALAEQAQALVDDHQRLFDWLQSGEGEPPDCCLSDSEEHRDSVSRLVDALARDGITMDILEAPLTRDGALLSVLYRAGVVEPSQIVALLVSARLPSVMAEAASWKPRAFHDYPIDLPRFEYVKSQEES